MVGYQNTKYTLRPFTVPETNVPGEKDKRTKFNKAHSRTRIGIEHVYGDAKGRFPWLKLLSGRNIILIYQTVESLFILHNILRDYGDDPSAIDDFLRQRDDPAAAEIMGGQGWAADGGDDAQELRRQGQAHENAARLKADGIALRNRLVTSIQNAPALGF